MVKAIYTGSEYIGTASGYEDFGLVLESTSFYAEQGGQVQLQLLDNAIFDIDQMRYLVLFLPFTPLTYNSSKIYRMFGLSNHLVVDEVVHYESFP